MLSLHTILQLMFSNGMFAQFNKFQENMYIGWLPCICCENFTLINTWFLLYLYRTVVGAAN